MGGYTSGLTQYRFGRTSTWVAWFADAVSGAGGAQQQLVGDVEKLRSDWQAALGARRNVRADCCAGRGRKSTWRHLDTAHNDQRPHAINLQ